MGEKSDVLHGLLEDDANITPINEKIHEYSNTVFNKTSHTETIDSISKSTFSKGGTILVGVQETLPYYTPRPNIPPNHQPHLQDNSSDSLFTGEFIHLEMPGEKKKITFAKAPRECYICKETNTPEWRKGPTGKRTLCNACGLSFAKKEKLERNRLSILGRRRQSIDNIIFSLQDLFVNQIYAERMSKKKDQDI